MGETYIKDVLGTVKTDLAWTRDWVKPVKGFQLYRRFCGTARRLKAFRRLFFPSLLYILTGKHCSMIKDQLYIQTTEKDIHTHTLIPFQYCIHITKTYMYMFIYYRNYFMATE